MCMACRPVQKKPPTLYRIHSAKAKDTLIRRLIAMHMQLPCFEAATAGRADQSL
jgi:hypothetical protein